MKRSLAYLLLPFLFSCSHYLYQGQITEDGVDGKEHQHILSWNTTEYIFGLFDKAGDINLMTCGHPGLYSFSDDSGKIIFQGDLSKMEHPKGIKTKGEICGAILGHEIIDLIPPGDVKVSIYCDPKHEAWAMVKPMALKARRKPYVFSVSRVKSKEAAKCPGQEDEEVEEKEEKK